MVKTNRKISRQNGIALLCNNGNIWDERMERTEKILLTKKMGFPEADTKRFLDSGFMKNTEPITPYSLFGLLFHLDNRNEFVVYTLSYFVIQLYLPHYCRETN